ncbi:hypothetical protein [Pseudomonas entomophila]|uniref:Secreted protein n=2 Tax=Pseudomonas entomophila TaxID=312306 RepID=Q1I5E8_PSEE4|nr:hypothetical protein [Pseudomonas entomophila]WMW07138.1 hypothetical protein RAH46_07325 [Pseudomonas entomophila]CAK17137.1 conserved hypothetical protein; putative signal peptide [Pseudomonas entomophila L48]
MKLEIARALFFVGALGVTTVAAAAWEQPRPMVFSKAEVGEACPLPRVVVKPGQARVEPDHDLLLFLFGMRQGLRPFG